MKTGWPPGMLQDDDNRLSRWLANRPGARYQVRKNMTEQQPEALRLADELHDWGVTYASNFGMQRMLTGAAAELRRLHALCAEWEKKAATWLASPEAAQRLNGYRELAHRLNAAEQVNAQLLEALEGMLEMWEDDPSYGSDTADKGYAAIKAAKGEA